jgi:enoyl-CoA hydratase
MTVTIDKRPSYIVLTLDQPAQLNTLTAVTTEDLAQAFRLIETHSEVRCVILTFAGDRASSTGVELREPFPIDADPARAVSESGQDLCNQIEKCPVPVIAALDRAVGGCVYELMLACHLRIASPNSSFSLPETSLSRSLGAHGILRLGREIGSDYTLEIGRSGRTVLAEEALQIGLISRIVPESRLLIEAESLAKQICTMAPLAIRACLEAVTRGMELPLTEGLALESQLFARLFATNDVREGTSAFLEKRQPIFKGN